MRKHGTGFGPTRSPAPAGSVVASAVELALHANVTATIGSVPAAVNYAGLIAAGLNQFTITVPNVAPGDQVLVLTVADVRTLSTLYLNISN